MRGKGMVFASAVLCIRITPAYAGKRSQYKNMKQMCKDHPRLCGEKSTLSCIVEFSLGSPPPMRGKVGYRSRNFLTFRITPAYAGKRFRRQRGSKIYKDHPRLCGEKLITSGNSGMGIGSPPPMRGKEFTNGGRAKSVGITPAYAGKRIKEICVSYEYGDHPRLCGEKLNSGSKCKFQSGSPPPMRGKGRHCQIKILCHGITPAYAGKRVYLAPARLLVRDHPRLCGEKL